MPDPTCTQGCRTRIHKVLVYHCVLGEDMCQRRSSLEPKYVLYLHLSLPRWTCCGVAALSSGLVCVCNENCIGSVVQCFVMYLYVCFQCTECVFIQWRADMPVEQRPKNLPSHGPPSWGWGRWSSSSTSSSSSWKMIMMSSPT